MTGIIYKYTSPSGKSYIGQTIHPERRVEQHRKMEGDNAFHRAIKKYGFDNFTYEVLVTVDLDDEQELKQKLDFFERFYIRKYKTFENGYNMTAGGGGMIGFKMSDEVREKMSKAAKGKVVLEETKRKMSKVRKGRQPWNKGKITSEETKRKISESMKLSDIAQNRPRDAKGHYIKSA